MTLEAVIRSSHLEQGFAKAGRHPTPTPVQDAQRLQRQGQGLSLARAWDSARTGAASRSGAGEPLHLQLHHPQMTRANPVRPRGHAGTHLARSAPRADRHRQWKFDLPRRHLACRPKPLLPTFCQKCHNLALVYPPCVQAVPLEIPQVHRFGQGLGTVTRAPGHSVQRLVEASATSVVLKYLRRYLLRVWRRDRPFSPARTAVAVARRKRWTTSRRENHPPQSQRRTLPR